MQISPRTAFRIAGLVGFLGVACGAFGAHGLKAYFAQRPGTAEWWEKAVFYHLIHAVLMLVLTLVRPFPATAFILCALGVVGFSGSLYVLALSGPYWLVFVTPLGGLCLLGSWLALILAAARLWPDETH